MQKNNKLKMSEDRVVKEIHSSQIKSINPKDILYLAMRDGSLILINDDWQERQKDSHLIQISSIKKSDANKFESKKEISSDKSRANIPKPQNLFNSKINKSNNSHIYFSGKNITPDVKRRDDNQSRKIYSLVNDKKNSEIKNNNYSNKYHYSTNNSLGNFTTTFGSKYSKYPNSVDSLRYSGSSNSQNKYSKNNYNNNYENPPQIRKINVFSNGTNKTNNTYEKKFYDTAGSLTCTCNKYEKDQTLKTTSNYYDNYTKGSKKDFYSETSTSNYGTHNIINVTQSETYWNNNYKGSNKSQSCFGKYNKNNNSSIIENKKEYDCRLNCPKCQQKKENLNSKTTFIRREDNYDNCKYYERVGISAPKSYVHSHYKVFIPE